MQTRATLQEAQEPPAFACVSAPSITFQAPPHLAAAAERGALTERQLSTVRLACQALLQPPHAFFLGDGPGCGKTRVLAGVAACQELPVVWLVPNAQLARQALAEAESMGLALPSSLHVRSYAQLGAFEAPPAFVLLLDEAHLCRHACGTSERAALLQERAAAVLYSTATPASDAASLGYMSRLRLWGAGTGFADFPSLRRALGRWGAGAAELLALDLKRRGLYTCVRLPEVPVERLEVALEEPSRRVFDACAEAWRDSQAAELRRLFFARLVPALKARALSRRWRQDLASGFAIVVVVQGTGAAAEADAMTLRCCRQAGVVAPGALPLDALDEAAAALHPEPTGEVSGRQVRARGGAPGNAKSLEAFRDGRLRALTMSAAGTLGLNLTSPLPIRLYVLEMPWTPEVLAQQLGRCHRLNSRSPPQYYAVSLRTFSDLRVEASLSKRGEVLGALSCADASRSVLRGLPWSARLVRWVTLEMTTRLLASQLGLSAPPPQACRAPRQAQDSEEEAEDEEEGAKQPLRARAESALLALPRSDAFRAPEDLRTRFDALARALPKDLLATWLRPPWSPRTHSWLPAGSRAEVEVAAAALTLRARLPQPLVIHVLGFAAGAPHWDVAGTLQDLGADLRFLDLEQPRDFIDACSRGSLAAQERLVQCCREHAERISEVPPRLLRAEDYVLRRRKAAAYACDLTLRKEPFFVRLQAEVRCTLEPSKEPLLFVHKRGRLLGAGFDGEAWSARTPGSARSLGSANRRRGYATLGQLLEAEALDAVPVGALCRFRSLEHAALEKRRLTARRLSRTLTLAVQDPLAYWEHSLRLVLALRDTRGEPFVGLLLSDAPFRA